MRLGPRSTLLVSLIFAHSSSLGFAAEDTAAKSYQELCLKSVHNSYQRKESIEEMFGRYGLRSLELDIHKNKIFRPELEGDWYVYHTAIDPSSKVDRFGEGLQRIFAMTRGSHEPLTLFVDIKDPLDQAEHSVEALDSLLRNELREALFSPKDLLATCPGVETLAEFAKSCRWPDSASLAERVLVVFTSADASAYASSVEIALGRAGFWGAEVKSLAEADARPQAVFFNLAPATALKTDLGAMLQARNFVTRTWDINKAADWQIALSKGLNHIATNKVSLAADPWAIIPAD